MGSAVNRDTLKSPASTRRAPRGESDNGTRPATEAEHRGDCRPVHDAADADDRDRLEGLEGLDALDRDLGDRDRSRVHGRQQVAAALGIAIGQAWIAHGGPVTQAGTA
jgi:hypothetical protein